MLPWDGDSFETMVTERHPRKPTPIFIRYADHFVVLHKTEEVTKQAHTLPGEWLRPMGLELHPDKTRIVNARSGLVPIPRVLNHSFISGNGAR